MTNEKIQPILNEFEKLKKFEYLHWDAFIKITEPMFTPQQYPSCCAVMVFHDFNDTNLDYYVLSEVYRNFELFNRSYGSNNSFPDLNFTDFSREEVQNVLAEIISHFISLLGTRFVEMILSYETQSEWIETLDKVTIPNRVKRTYYFESSDGERDLIKFEFQRV